jgi:alpha-N-acetylglucosaminidase
MTAIPASGRTDAFDGKNWVYGYVHNYGGSNPVYGDLEFYRRDLAALAGNPQAGHLRGFGLFPEGLHSNSIVYAYAYDLAWGQSAQAPLAGWLRPYLRSRYGAASPRWSRHGRRPCAAPMPRAIGRRAGGRRRQAPICCFKRPSCWARTIHPRPAIRGAASGDCRDRRRAAPWPRLLAYDMVDLPGTRPACARSRPVRRRCRLSRRGCGAGDAAAARAKALAQDIDALIGGQQETLGSWLAQARAYGTTPAEQASFVTQAKAVTVWGGRGTCPTMPRARAGSLSRLLLAALGAVPGRPARGGPAHPFDEATSLARIRAFEQAWLSDGKLWPGQAPANPAAAVARVLAEADHD